MYIFPDMQNRKEIIFVELYLELMENSAFSIFIIGDKSKNVLCIRENFLTMFFSIYNGNIIDDISLLDGGIFMDNTNETLLKTDSKEIEISVLDFKEVDIAYTIHEPGRC